MSKVIKVVRISTPPDIKRSIKFIVDQLEKQKYAYVNNIVASRLFARFCRDFKPSILVTPGDGVYVKNIITLDPNYMLERVSDFSFRLKIEVINDKTDGKRFLQKK
jgi:signal peptidase I